MKTEHIAKVAHEINAALCLAFGDDSQPSWRDAPEWQKQSAMTQVEFHLANPDASPSATHDSWLAEKRAGGWRYGQIKDPENKRHNCMLPFRRLTPEQKAQDYLFQQVVHSLTAVERRVAELQG